MVAEIAQEMSPKSNLTKKRSLFRSPDTASSPDLATLVKRAKDRGPVSHVDMQQWEYRLEWRFGYNQRTEG